MFTGFNVKYPEYEVIIPSGASYSLRSMNVQEEEKMKASLVTPSKTAEHLNKTIYELIVKKPDNITDFNTFLKNVTLKDRDVLLYGLYHVTYEEIRNYDINCDSCKKSYPVTVKASDTFSMTMYPNGDILTKLVPLKLPVLENIRAVIKQPTLWDEFTAIKSLSSRPGSTIDMITECLIIDHFEQDLENTVAPQIISDRVDIIDAYMTLPSRDKRKIIEVYTEEFGKYGLDLKMKSYCPHCGEEEDVKIDIVANFFRSLYGL